MERPFSFVQRALRVVYRNARTRTNCPGASYGALCHLAMRSGVK